VRSSAAVAPALVAVREALATTARGIARHRRDLELVG
jgi:hypothetical protein